MAVAFLILVALVPLSIVAIALSWLAYGKAPSFKEAIIPEYEAPEGLTPLELSVIEPNTFYVKDDATMASELMYLAGLGCITITRGGMKKATWISRNTQEIRTFRDFTLSRRDTVPPAPHDLALLHLMFWQGDSISFSDALGHIWLSSVPESAADSTETKRDSVLDSLDRGTTSVDALRFMAKRELVEKGYFGNTAIRLKQGLSLLAIVLLLSALPVTVGGFFLLDTLGIHSDFLESLLIGYLPFAIVEGPLLLIASLAFNRPTIETLRMRNRVRGFRQYLSVVAGTAPVSRSAEEFAKQLPYAFALGLEKQWTGEFDAIAASDLPSWYAHLDVVLDSAQTFTDEMDTFTDSMRIVLMGRPNTLENAPETSTI